MCIRDRSGRALGPGATVGVLGTGVPRLACLRPVAWLKWRPSMAHLHQHELKTLARGQALRGGRQEASSGIASSGWLARRRRDQGGVPHEVPMTQAMTTKGARRALARTVSSFPLWCKGASATAEYRGIRQRLPFRCNETKTSGAAGWGSPWSPRRRHHRCFWQPKTIFSQDNLYYMFPFKMAVVGALPAQYLGRGPGPL